MKRLLNATAVVVASSLLLAACGGGSDDETAETPPVVDQPVPEPVDTASSLLAEADKLKKSAMTSAEAADKVEGMLTPVAVHGNSQAAVNNAMTILMAESDIAGDLAMAQAALAKAQALPDDAAGKDAAVQFIEDAIESIEENARTVKMFANDVRHDRVKPRTAGHYGTEVAKAINAAFVTGDARTPSLDSASPPAAKGDTGYDSLVMMDDHQGQTWSEIVKANGVMTKMMRIGTAGANTTKEVEVMSVAGMTLTSAVSGDATDGTQADGTYMGIGGTVICAGDDCKVEAAGGSGMQKLVGSWYFTPDSAAQIYVRANTEYGAPYTPEGLYAEFGHWLSFDNGVATINRFSRPHLDDELTGDQDPGAPVWDANDKLAGSATYEGSAAGMSVVRNSDDEPVSSGAFTADVTLMATFGGDPKLSGTIDNFKGHTGSGWTVTLEEQTGANTGVSGVAVTNGSDGTWSATAYGKTGMRPTGIHGGFDANFMDGEAAGAYATRAE